MGQVPVVGRMVVILSVVLGEARKWEARQVRCVVAVHAGEGQMRVLAPELGKVDEQRVHF